MALFKKQFRIVKDSFAGYEVQCRYLFFPIWFQVSGRGGFFSNTNKTIDEAEKLIQNKINKEIKRTKWI